MAFRNIPAIAAGKLSAWASQTFRFGSGSSLPGMLALKIAPNILSSLAQNITHAIVVTGTNGKSTTAGLLHTILNHLADQDILNNHLGANMKTGITTALLKKSTVWGKIKSDTAVYEVDEASLPGIAPDIKQSWTVVTNLFRDQLDRYGELDTTARYIAKGIEKSEYSGLILNADDPLVTNIANLVENKSNRPIIYFGFSEAALLKYKAERPNVLLETVPIPTEVTDCPKCRHRLNYQLYSYGHLGHYQCNYCEFKRPETQVTLLDYTVKPGEPAQLNIQISADKNQPEKHLKLITHLEGRFNFYNLLAAIAGVYKMNNTLDETRFQEGLNQYQSIFGRSQVCTVNNKPVIFYLIKNPIGAGEVLKTISQTENRQCLIVINDHAADGKDISWLWDAPFEILGSSTNPIIVSGRRADDMALRLQYGGVPVSHIRVVSDPIAALQTLTDETQHGQTAFILPTYTALLAYSQHLGTR